MKPYPLTVVTPDGCQFGRPRRPAGLPHRGRGPRPSWPATAITCTALAMGEAPTSSRPDGNTRSAACIGGMLDGAGRPGAADRHHLGVGGGDRRRPGRAQPPARRGKTEGDRPGRAGASACPRPPAPRAGAQVGGAPLNAAALPGDSRKKSPPPGSRKKTTRKRSHCQGLFCGSFCSAVRALRRAAKPGKAKPAGAAGHRSVLARYKTSSSSLRQSLCGGRTRSLYQTPLPSGM